MVKLSNIYCCPACKGELTFNKNEYTCNYCSKSYPIINEIPIFLIDDETDNYRIYWDKGWANRSKIGDQKFHRKPKKDYNEDIQNILRRIKENKNSVTSITKQKTNDILLNIGCGMMEAPVIIKMGINNYIGIDYSFTASKSSLESIKKLDGHGVTLQSNAESLPIKTASISQVYTAGVLHHTPNIILALDEINRVLKPSGRVVLGLYYTFSPKFIAARIVGTIKGLLKKRRFHWYTFSEESWKTNGLSNQWTKTYSKKQIISMLKKYNYSDIRFRKIGFNWGDCIPILGKYFQKTTIGKKSAFLLREKFGSMLVVTFIKN